MPKPTLNPAQRALARAFRDTTETAFAVLAEHHVSAAALEDLGAALLALYEAHLVLADDRWRHRLR